MDNNFVKNKRLEKGLTQIGLAEKTGLSVLTIINIENGKANPNLTTMKSIAKVLDSKLDELFGK